MIGETIGKMCEMISKGLAPGDDRFILTSEHIVRKAAELTGDDSLNGGKLMLPATELILKNFEDTIDVEDISKAQSQNLTQDESVGLGALQEVLRRRTRKNLPSWRAVISLGPYTGCENSKCKMPAELDMAGGTKIGLYNLTYMEGYREQATHLTKRAAGKGKLELINHIECNQQGGEMTTHWKSSDAESNDKLDMLLLMPRITTREYEEEGLQRPRQEKEEQEKTKKNGDNPGGDK